MYTYAFTNRFIMITFLLLIVGSLLCSTAAILDKRFCESESCKILGNGLILSMNLSVNPCEDFYEFTCGNFLKNFPIPKTDSSNGVIEQLEKIQEKQMKNILEQINENDLKISNSVRLTGKIYQECLNSKPGLLKDFLNQTFNEHQWQLGRSIVDYNQTWSEIYVNFITKTGIMPIFNVNVSPDQKNVTENILNLNTADLGIGVKELINKTLNPELIVAYENFIINSAKEFCNDCSLENIKKDVKDLIDFEGKLASIKMSMEEQHDLNATYKKLTILEFDNETNFDWYNNIIYPTFEIFTKNQQSDIIDISDEIAIDDYEFFKNIINILKETPVRTFDNYLMWMLIYEKSAYADEISRNNSFEFNKVYSGIKEQENLTQICQSFLSNDLIWAMSSVWVEKFFTQNEKDEAIKIINNVQNSFGKVIEHSSWLDVDTKVEALQKLNRVTKNVAFPQWLKNATELDEFYNLSDENQTQLIFKQNNFLTAITMFRIIGIENQFDEFDSYIEIDKSWPFPPFIVNAAYQPEQNSITIPAGQLKAPFFDIEYPSSINYGDIGCTIGHELTHGFDDTGRNFDKDGNLKSWWTDLSIEKYNQRSECFVKQYSKIVEPLTGLNLNGINTLGENIADNGGLNEAFRAFLKNKKSEPKIKELAEYSPEQLFFISYGYSWCSESRYEALRKQILYDPHSPAKYRVNIPLSNSEEFARVFKCPAGSAMNPHEKCILW